MLTCPVALGFLPHIPIYRCYIRFLNIKKSNMDNTLLRSATNSFIRTIFDDGIVAGFLRGEMFLVDRINKNDGQKNTILAKNSYIFSTNA